MSEQDRGLATGLLGFIAIIVIGALMYTLMDPAASLIFDTASDRATGEAQTAIDTRKRIWDVSLYVVLLMSTIFIIARAVFESRRPG